MGKIKGPSLRLKFSPQQLLILDEFRRDEFLQKNFYFTGGTALSAYYFAHRESEDLDFFTEGPLPRDKVQEFMTNTARKHNFTFNLREMEEFQNIAVYSIYFDRDESLKVDFNSYPYPQVEESKLIDGLYVDSLRDIGINKLQSITQRTEIKDFVDLYFLLKEFTLWDLIYGVEAKFRMKIDKFLLGADFMKVEGFKKLPKMLVPLTIPELQDFFRKRARELAKEVVE